MKGPRICFFVFLSPRHTDQNSTTYSACFPVTLREGICTGPRAFLFPAISSAASDPVSPSPVRILFPAVANEMSLSWPRKPSNKAKRQRASQLSAREVPDRETQKRGASSAEAQASHSLPHTWLTLFNAQQKRGKAPEDSGVVDLQPRIWRAPLTNRKVSPELDCLTLARPL